MALVRNDRQTKQKKKHFVSYQGGLDFTQKALGSFSGFYMVSCRRWLGGLWVEFWTHGVRGLSE